MAAADPYSAAFGAIASVATPAPAGPSEAKSSGAIGGANFNNSGWNVTFGTNSGIRSDVDNTAPGSVTGAVAGMAQYLPYVAVAVVVLVIWKKRKSS